MNKMYYKPYYRASLGLDFMVLVFSKSADLVLSASVSSVVTALYKSYYYYCYYYYYYYCYY